MLLELHVTDLGIVADLDLVLGPGLTAITGETGAGKTLIVEAVELLVGGRADADLVRDGAAEARIEGRFVDPNRNDETVLTRVVPREGRSRAYIDGGLATAAELGAIGARFVDLHGQHAHQSLLEPAVQRRALDRFIGPAAEDALLAYRAARAGVREVDAELAGLGGDARARAREIDLLRFQRDEIDAARLDDPDEDDSLAAQEETLADAAAHREASAAAYEAIEGPARDAAGVAIAALDGRSSFAELVTRLRAAQAELADIGEELRRAADEIVDDPVRLDAVRERRRLLYDVRRKYGATLTEVLEYRDDVAARLAELEGYESRAATLEQRRNEHEREAASAASALSKLRRDAAGALAAAVEVHLHELAMPHARMEVEVRDAPAVDDGTDDVTFLLAPNPGEAARPIARAASGGELARAMLAVRVVLSEAPPSLVFDEVDAGIGGEAGIAVGRLLAALAARHQVLCVTHLAQVAAFAGTQIVVEKAVEQDGRAARTVAEAIVVDGEARLVELSRMLAGVGESTHARRHAAELLAAAATPLGRGRSRRTPG